jgi:hypothetical protein
MAGETIDEYSGLLIGDQLRDNEPDYALTFSLVEAARARTLLDELSDLLPRPSPADTDEFDSLEREALHFYPVALSADLRETGLTSELPITSDYELLSRRLPGLEALLAHSQDRPSQTARVAALADVMEALKPDELLAEYVIPYDKMHPARELWLFAITSSSCHAIQAPLDLVPEDTFFARRLFVDSRAPFDESALGKAVVALRLAIQAGDDPTADSWLQVLHDVLLNPLQMLTEDLAGVRRMVIVPHRVLHALPWGALLGRDGRRLLDRVSVVLAPSASAWLRLRKQRTRTPQRFIGMLIRSSRTPN